MNITLAVGEENVLRQFEQGELTILPSLVDVPKASDAIDTEKLVGAVATTSADPILSLEDYDVLASFVANRPLPQAEAVVNDILTMCEGLSRTKTSSNIRNNQPHHPQPQKLRKQPHDSTPVESETETQPHISVNQDTAQTPPKFDTSLPRLEATSPPVHTASSTPLLHHNLSSPESYHRPWARTRSSPRRVAMSLSSGSGDAPNSAMITAITPAERLLTSPGSGCLSERRRPGRASPADPGHVVNAVLKRRRRQLNDLVESESKVASPISGDHAASSAADSIPLIVDPALEGASALLMNAKLDKLLRDATTAAAKAQDKSPGSVEKKSKVLTSGITDDVVQHSASLYI